MTDKPCKECVEACIAAIREMETFEHKQAGSATSWFSVPVVAKYGAIKALEALLTDPAEELVREYYDTLRDGEYIGNHRDNAVKFSHFILSQYRLERKDGSHLIEKAPTIGE